MRKTPENEATQEILLGTSERVWWFRNVVEVARPVYSPSTKRTYGLGKGTPDYIGFVKATGRIIFCEHKRHDGGRVFVRPEQAVFISLMRRAGQIALVAGCAADVHRAIDEAEERKREQWAQAKQKLAELTSRDAGIEESKLRWKREQEQVHEPEAVQFYLSRGLADSKQNANAIRLALQDYPGQLAWFDSQPERIQSGWWGLSAWYELVYELDVISARRRAVVELKKAVAQ